MVYLINRRSLKFLWGVLGWEQPVRCNGIDFVRSSLLQALGGSYQVVHLVYDVILKWEERGWGQGEG